MELMINGVNLSYPIGYTILELINDFKYPTSGLVVVVNEEVIPSEKWDGFKLEDKNIVEFLNFVSGG